MLAALYTDTNALSRVGKLARMLDSRGLAPPKIRALSARIPEGVPPEKIRSFDRLLYASLPGMRAVTDLSSAYLRSGVQGADVVYSMYGEEFRFLKWAKTQGCRIAVDVFIHPDTFRIMEKEAASHSGQRNLPKGMVQDQWEHSRRTFALADMLLCPSEWVASGVRELFPEYAGKIHLLPYGSSVAHATSINPNPQPGRILFAGRDVFRKGLHYLAEAAAIVRSEGIELDVRVAGIDAEQLSWMPDVDALNCIGILPMDKMQVEFQDADVFVLPSLSEGQAGVLLEAMASGCPVIATRESGVDFKPGCGVAVPARDAYALARAIVEVVSDREKRTALAEGALRQSMDYSMGAWKNRLVNAMRELASTA
jgi:glycosyltransferase involved in cell wall biosynthesis